MILLDVSTSYHFRHWKPMGILRVEHEVIRAFDRAYGAQVIKAIYDPKTDGFYKIPDAMFEELVFHNGYQPVPPPRAMTARSKWRSWARIARFLLAARRGRVEEKLLRLSLPEYSQMTHLLRRLTPVLPGLRQKIVALDQINHLAHHGLLTPVEQQICSPENKIDPGSVRHYISAGGFWSDNRYRLAYSMRQAFGWKLHYLIYDLIPILWGHLAEPSAKRDFPVALHWLLWGVDQIWTISETTKRDLLSHIDQNGYPPIDTGQVTPVYLGCDIDKSRPGDEGDRQILSGFGLTPGKFVLMVGTQEPRKNHDFAYRLWRELHQRYPGQVMELVWVGQPGWAIDGFLNMVRADYGLPEGAIRILPDVDDRGLSALYRACHFTIYPSHYEGWGLPVVESLNHGKPCLTSTAPSLIEAGTGAAEAIDLFDGNRWIERCHMLMNSDTAYRQAMKQAKTFQGFSWAGFRDALTTDFDRVYRADQRSAPECVRSQSA